MPAYSDGGQRIVDAETSRCRHFHVKIHQPFHPESHAQLSRFPDQPHILGPQVIVFPDTIPLHLAGMALQHRVHMGVVTVDNAHPALPKQQTLAVQILLKAGMLVGSDMIRFQIGEYPQIKHKPLGAVEHQPLGGHLHNHRIHARLHHLGKVLLQSIRFRRGIARVDVFPADDHLDGAHQAHLVTRIFQNGFHHVGGGGLPLGAGDADDPQFFRRISEICRGDKCHGIPSVGHLDHGPTDFGIIITPLLFYLPGINIGKQEDVGKINFDIVFLILGCMAIGAAGGYIGLGDILSAYVVPLLGDSGAIGLIAFVFFFCAIFNLLLTPFAIYAAFSAAFAQIAFSMGINPAVIMITMIIAGDTIFLPYEHNSGLMSYAFGMMSMKDFFKASLVRGGIQTIALLAIMIPYWHISGILYL